MSAYVSRQVQASLARELLEDIAAARAFPFRERDVLQKVALVVGDGEYSYRSEHIDDSSYTVPLPVEYSSSDRLVYAIRCEGIIKATIVSPDHGTSTFLVKGTKGTTDGVHDGLLIGCGTVTSIALIADTDGDVFAEWFLFKLPDLADADSYRIGQRALGVVT